MRRLLKIIIPLIGRRGLIFYTLLSLAAGFVNFLFINRLTSVIGLLISKDYTSVSSNFILLFISIIFLVIWIRRALSLAIVDLSQNLLWKIRKQILGSILSANYQQLATRKPRIYSAVVNDVDSLTHASLNTIGFITSGIMTIACLIYLGSISITLFFITFGVALLGVAIHQIGSAKNMRSIERVRELDSLFLEYLNSILNGFKEIFIEPKKGTEIYETKINSVAVESFYNNRKAFTGILNNQITGQVLFYVLITSILLIFSINLGISAESVVSFVFTLLYLLSSIESITVLLPGFIRAGVACNHLLDLQAELEGADFDNISSNKTLSIEEFESIDIEGLRFDYKNTERVFGIGPIHLKINKGDVIFIFGSNGSGKTTLINSVLGLSTPTAGEIRINREIVSNQNFAWYKSSFSAVFSDFFLFDHLYGIDTIDIKLCKTYLELFELDAIVQLQGKSFSTSDLSTGQRKRLALVSSLLEKKPILILDEWAADQDPYFRKKFYNVVIPLLKKEGITIIAITHDDHYYHCADKLFKMDSGNLIPISLDKHSIAEKYIF